MTWLNHAQDHFSRLVIAMDDLDKKDTPVIQNILEGSAAAEQCDKLDVATFEPIWRQVQEKTTQQLTPQL